VQIVRRPSVIPFKVEDADLAESEMEHFADSLGANKPRPMDIVGKSEQVQKEPLPRIPLAQVQAHPIDGPVEVRGWHLWPVNGARAARILGKRRHPDRPSGIQQDA
jgi:hypothetical protein